MTGRRGDEGEGGKATGREKDEAAGESMSLCGMWYVFVSFIVTLCYHPLFLLLLFVPP